MARGPGLPFPSDVTPFCSLGLGPGEPWETQGPHKQTRPLPGSGSSCAHAAHSSSGELCKTPLWQDMNPLAWRETDHSGGQYLTKQTVFGSFHRKYLSLSRGYVLLLAVTRRTETIGPSATSPHPQKLKTLRGSCGPTAPSAPQEPTPHSPAAHMGQLMGDTAHGGGWVQQLTRGHLTWALAMARKLAHSRARGDRGTGVPGWCTHVHLLQAPWSLGHRGGNLGDRPGGRGSVWPPGSSKHSLLLPLHRPLPPKGQGAFDAAWGAPQAWHGLCWLVVCQGDAPDALGELAPGLADAEKGGGGRALLPGKPEPLCIPEGGRGACQPEATQL